MKNFRYCPLFSACVLGALSSLAPAADAILNAPEAIAPGSVAPAAAIHSAPPARPVAAPAPPSVSAKNPVPENRPVETLPAPVTRELSRGSIDLFGVYVTPDSHDHFGSSFGGGLGVTSYLNAHLGFSASVYFWDSGETTVATGTGSMIVRVPSSSPGIAPYLIGGGGGHINAREEFTLHAGIGLEINVPGLNDWSVFAEGTYNWAEDTGDYLSVRAGTRYHF